MRVTDQVAVTPAESRSRHLPSACCCLSVVAAEKALSQLKLIADTMIELSSASFGACWLSIEKGAGLSCEGVEAECKRRAL
jgi:hypothetical protein